jgi:hypothetical protein
MDKNSKYIEGAWDEHLKCEFETHVVKASINIRMSHMYIASYHNLNWRYMS